MKKIITNLIIGVLIFTLSSQIYASPVIPLKNGGNCSYYIYRKIENLYNIKLPVNNGYLSQWRKLENIKIDEYSIKFYDYPVSDSIMLMSPEDFKDNRKYAHVAWVYKVYNSILGTCMLVEESGTTLAPTDAQYLGNCWYRNGWYLDQDYPNVKYIKLEKIVD